MGDLKNTRYQTKKENIRKNLKVFYEVGSDLRDIRDEKLYLEEYGTFEEFCRSEYGMMRANAYRLINAAAVVDNLSPIGDILPTVETQARPLTKIKDPEIQREVWKRALETAPNGRVTERHVKDCVDEELAPTPVLDLELESVGTVTLEPVEPEPHEVVEFLKPFVLAKNEGAVVPEEFAEMRPDVNEACNIIAKKMKDFVFDIEPVAAWLDHVEDPKAYAKFMGAVYFLNRVTTNVIKHSKGEPI